MDSLGSWIHLQSNQPVLQEGSSPNYVYVICSGTIKLTTSSYDGRLLILRIVGPGDVLGLAAVLKQNPYETSAETLEPCVIKSIPRTQFLSFMEEFEAVSRNSLRAVANEYQSAVLTAKRLALSGSAAAKLASVLSDWGKLILAGQHNDACPHPLNEVSFHMPLTHEELGHMAGVSRETATRVLLAFRRDGLVRIESDRMVLPDLMRLREQAG
ncbi:Crp/Fnr family transcriptional regulator [Silvibacterium acidisoli]|uniref:Crp/Fnr family transcriptional regulator n=1 Tax=Acidobacteriaceae bacterium ZG23-2 TaxID=2883246 RepID=UPI00406D17A6